jgi:hypothetical protein
MQARQTPDATRRPIMAKGQIRGNKEVKKPKKTAQPVVPVSSFLAQAKPDKPAKPKS